MGIALVKQDQPVSWGKNLLRSIISMLPQIAANAGSAYLQNKISEPFSERAEAREEARDIAKDTRQNTALEAQKKANWERQDQVNLLKQAADMAAGARAPDVGVDIMARGREWAPSYEVEGPLQPDKPRFEQRSGAPEEFTQRLQSWYQSQPEEARQAIRPTSIEDKMALEELRHRLRLQEGDQRNTSRLGILQQQAEINQALSEPERRLRLEYQNRLLGTRSVMGQIHPQDPIPSDVIEPVPLPWQKDKQPAALTTPSRSPGKAQAVAPKLTLAQQKLYNELKAENKRDNLGATDEQLRAAAKRNAQ